MAEELHDKVESVSGGGGTRYREIYCKNCGSLVVRISLTDDKPVDFPTQPCSICGSRDFGSRSVK